MADQSVKFTLARSDKSRVIKPIQPWPPSSKYLAATASELSAEKGSESTNRSPKVKWLPFTDGESPDFLCSRIPTVENTYKLGPDPEIVFRQSRITTAIQDLIEYKLKDMRYDPSTSAKSTADLSNDVIARVKKLGFKRHKFVAHVSMGNIQGQGFNLASRCLWDERKDGQATVKYQTKELFASVVVYAVYFE